jgi:preprotein translocase subunit SecF
MRFFHDTHLDFVKIRRQAMLGSAIVIATGLVSIAIHRGLESSIDFAGGALVEIGLEKAVPTQDIRSVMSNAGFKDAEITRFGSPTDFLIKVKHVGAPASADSSQATAAKVANDIKAKLSAGIGGQKVDVRRVESVGPKIGSELRTAAFWAVIYSLIGILVYVTWRFQFRFAVAAIAALVHDVSITIGFFSLAGIEMSLPAIAAILTIVGYSLNDTIVVFDRIRENMGLRRRENLGVLINTSVNETLSRTIITSGTTLLALIALLAFGGEVIRDFALTLTVGIVVGTYSSVFIAAPIVLEWHMRKPTKQK